MSQIDALSERERAMLQFSEKLTRRPHEMEETDVRTLRERGLDDDEILETTLITAYFNMMNRIADGLGVELDEAFQKAERQG